MSDRVELDMCEVESLQDRWYYEEQKPFMCNENFNAELNKGFNNLIDDLLAGGNGAHKRSVIDAIKELAAHELSEDSMECNNIEYSVIDDDNNL